MTGPGPLPPVSRRAWTGLALLAAGTALLYALYWTPYGADDPWITYRYAENLADGHGFAYNPGERVMGTTTPLYTGVLALARLAGLPVPAASWAIGFAGMLAALALVFLLGRRLHSEAAGLVAAGLLGSAQLFHRVVTYGMETPLYVTLILGAFAAYLSGRELLAALLAGLCLLTRLDGGAVGVTLMAVHVVTRREFPLRAAAVYLAVTAPWFLFSLGYFGSLVPNSMVAKRLHTDHSLILWMPGWLVREPRAWLAGAGALFLLASPAARARAAAPVLWAALYAAAYTFGQIQRYDWYQTPLLAVLALLAGVGVLELAARAGAGRARLAAAALLVAVAVAPDVYRAARRAGGHEGILGIERLRYEAAVWMRDSLPPGAPIATGGIGLVGYHTRRHIFDAMGLVTPGSMRLEGPLADVRNVPFPRFLPAVIADHDPEFVFDGFWLPPGETMPAFMRGRYEVVREWRGANPRWPRFILYRRTGGAAAGSPG
jgi:arabinofuranosyltransferase